MPIFLKNVNETQSKVYGYPKKFSKNIKQDLNTTGFDIVKKNVMNKMPIGGRTGAKNHVHAREGKSMRKASLKGKYDYRVLGFYATFYKKYWYLKFPNDGTGQSRNRRPLKFLEKGALASRKPIQKLVNDSIKNSHL